MATIILRPISDITKGHTAGKEGDNAECDGSSSTAYNMINEVTADDKTTIIGHHNSSSTASESISQFNLTTFTLNKKIRINSITPFVRWRNDQSDGTAEVYMTVLLNDSAGKESSWSSGGSSYSSYHNNSETYSCASYYPTDVYTASSSGLVAKLTVKTRCASASSKNVQDVNITQVYVTIDYDEIEKYKLKVNGTWKNVTAYQKVSGSWVALGTNQPSGWSANCAIQGIHCPWNLNYTLQRGESLVSYSGYAVSDYIPVTPGVELIVQGMGSVNTNTMWLDYKSDKTYNDYWGGSGTSGTSPHGKTIYKRTLSASNMTNVYYIRVNIYMLDLEYCKVWQNGNLLFDGSLYPIT